MARALDRDKDNAKIANKILQAARVCELPTDRSKFINVCKDLIESNRWDWLNESLKNYPDQQKVSYKELLSTEVKLGITRLY